VTLLVGQIGLGLIEAGKLYAIMQGTGVVFRIAWGALNDRGVDARRLLAFIGLGSIVFTLILAVADSSWSWTSLVLVSIGIGATTISWNGIYLAEIPRQVPQAQVSAATAGTVMFSFAGVVAGPVTFSAIVAATGSYLPAFVAFNAATLLCVMYLLRAREASAAK
jgi:nitrate/nitrite transporter NarK